MTYQPAWVADKIAVAARKASEATCARCGTPVLAGLDADRCALPVVVDAARLTTALAELRALMAGRQTYALIDGELCHRTDFHHRAPLGRHPLHAEHRCPGGNP